MKISVVVPCYNEEDALPHFWTRFSAAAETVPGADFEVLFVDDGSRDGTRALLLEIAQRDARARVMSLSRNFGKEAALVAGFAQATGDLVSVMDADLQDPPELLAAMLETLQATGCDCVAVRRVTRAGEPPVRSFFSRLFYRLINRFSAVPIQDGARDFRLMRREMADAVLRLREKRRFAKHLFVWPGFDVRNLEYENAERVAGVTKWSFAGLFRYAFEGLFSVTAAPLALPFVLAGLAFPACLILLLAGAGLAALLCGLATCALLGIGALGMYLGRLFWEAKKRPLYVARKANSSDTGDRV